MVFELIRTKVLGGGYTDQTFTNGSGPRPITADLPLWYQRRNCLAHGGACACRGTNSAPSAKQQACLDGRTREGTSPGMDPSLMTLRTVCEIALARELHGIAKPEGKSGG